MADKPLKITVDKLDDVPEPARALYVERDGKFHLNAEIPDTSTLETTLERERTGRKEAEKAAKAFKELGLSPDDIRALVATAEDAKRKKASDAGDFKALEAQLVEKHNRELAAVNDSNKKLRTRVETLLIDNVATQALASAKGNATLLLPHVKARTRIVEGDDGEPRVQVLNEKGEPRISPKPGSTTSDLMTIGELVNEMKGSADFAAGFAASGGAGGGAPPNNGGGAPPAVKPAWQMNAAEKVAFIAAAGGGQAGHAAYLEHVEKTGIPPAGQQTPAA